jgi:DNA polymerase-3 subunit epsilon
MIVVFDLETTGKNPNKDRIIQIGAVKVDENFVEKDRYVIKVNPLVPITEGATEIHGISDEDVSSCKPFQTIGQEFLDFIEECDLAGFNILSFDIPLLAAECRRCGFDFNLDGRRLLDAFVIFRKFEKRDLAGAYRLYCKEELIGGHDALVDTMATTAILEEQIEFYKAHPEDPLPDLDAVHKATLGKRVTVDGKIVWDDNNEACIGFGKHKGVLLRIAVTRERGYIRWMLRGEFSDSVKDILRKALKGEFPERKV